ncbi:MAG: hypothetical protein ACD_71C00069G0003 [uncultured bacterium (gcode 4)]|uniref:Uncharacterized protein n=1 Tax=uncultured bacterium (gcode 4) TaxID=1234023 RepID=K1ZJN8_9BACT|nr:MAG: hypothetical protein ACD_71C00069G0003 [uncultured bacterium (gcode 4)]
MSSGNLCEKPLVYWGNHIKIKSRRHICGEAEEIDCVSIKRIFLGDIDREMRGEISRFFDSDIVVPKIENSFGVVIVVLIIDSDTIRRRENMDIDDPKRLQKGFLWFIIEMKKLIVVDIVSLEKEKKKPRKRKNYRPKNSVFIFPGSEICPIWWDHTIYN